jgi:hypothetical protein
MNYLELLLYSTVYEKSPGLFSINSVEEVADMEGYSRLG